MTSSIFTFSSFSEGALAHFVFIKHPLINAISNAIERPEGAASRL
jgi:hypothetical protein